MIASVRGIILSHTQDTLVVEVGGVGLLVQVPATVFDGSVGIGRTIHLHTYLAVREDALTLYGFPSEEERKLFETLIGVPGVGPKMALSVLSHLSTDMFRSALASEDPALLSRVPGVGKKTAEKMIVFLKDKLTGGLPVSQLVGVTALDTELIAALTALGYSLVESQAAIQSIPKDTPADIEQRLLIALRYFS